MFPFSQPGRMPGLSPLVSTVLALLPLSVFPLGDGGASSPGGSGVAARTPRRYRCLRATAPPVIDGRLDDACWKAVPWTSVFVDIEGPQRPDPPLRTRAKMCWDSRAFYFAFELEEPHVWATLKQRDAVIFQDNDIELFIDPDGDTHAYYELEVNAFGTEWDLLLIKPYRDHPSPAVTGWDIAGLQTAVHVDGTLNDPSDRDRGWSVEVAIPWPALGEGSAAPSPPRAGDLWRVNFSRVEWETVQDGTLTTKACDPTTGKPLSEHNWVWSPQGAIAMHRPEEWGLVLFDGGEGKTPWPGDLEEELGARAALRRLYYAEKAYRAGHGCYAADAGELLGAPDEELGGYRWPPSVDCTPSGFEALLSRPDGRTLHITQDGRIWRVGGAH